jgi:chorismate mutase/prephenate dehydratase
VDLQEIRTQLNGIDDQMLSLFCRRMALVKDVAAYKIEHHLPVLDANREQAIIDRVSQAAGEEMGGYARVLFQTLMALSRDYQEKQISGEKP